MSRAKFWINRLLLLLTPTGGESGQALAEYTLVFVMVVLAGVMAVTVIGVTTNGHFVDILGAFG